MNSSQKTLKCLLLKNTSILDQLLLEEALFRTNHGNWLIQNHGGSNISKCIVLGISGNIQQLVHTDYTDKQGIPLIRRFTGGGTVFIDSNIMFSSLILDRHFTGIEFFPKNTMEWTGKIFQEVFNSSFDQLQNDYVVRQDTNIKKIGGNAQSFSKDHCVHHTSFLMGLNQEDIHKCLKMPSRQPEYRGNREHGTFLTSVGEAFPHLADAEILTNSIRNVYMKKALGYGYDVEIVDGEAIESELRCIVRDYMDKKLQESTFRSTCVVNSKNEIDYSFSLSKWFS